MNLFILFIILNIFNVIIQTAKSIITIKCDKFAAAIVNAIAYGFYTIILVYTVSDLPLVYKVCVTAICNLIGVYVVKFGEEIFRKDKLWKIEATLKKEYDWPNRLDELRHMSVPTTYIDIGEYIIINFFCYNKSQTKIVEKKIKEYGAKFFASESKI